MSATLSILQLRLLIRNDEALIEHYQQSVDRAAEDSTCMALGYACGLKDRWDAALIRLQVNRARLEGLRCLRECAQPIAAGSAPAFALGK